MRCTCEQFGNGVVSGQVDPPAPAGRLWDPLCEKHPATTNKQLYQKRYALWEKAKGLEAQAYALREQAEVISKQLDRNEYTCSCVHLNKDIGIFDCVEQEKANRKGLGLGLVAETLSAAADCPKCKGKGKPQ
jgi:hypothetical protein